MNDILCRMTDGEKHLWCFGFTAGVIDGAVGTGAVIQLLKTLCG